jgi:hypothetical protein
MRKYTFFRRHAGLERNEEEMHALLRRFINLACLYAKGVGELQGKCKNHFCVTRDREGVTDGLDRIMEVPLRRSTRGGGERKSLITQKPLSYRHRGGPKVRRKQLTTVRSHGRNQGTERAHGQSRLLGSYETKGYHGPFFLCPLRFFYVYVG